MEDRTGVKNPGQNPVMTDKRLNSQLGAEHCTGEVPSQHEEGLQVWEGAGTAHTTVICTDQPAERGSG